MTPESDCYDNLIKNYDFLSVPSVHNTTLTITNTVLEDNIYKGYIKNICKQFSKTSFKFMCNLCALFLSANILIILFAFNDFLS